MVRGQADYGALAAKEASASISDMGEVAARLGSIVTYDKRGDVVDFDNFEEPVIRWKKIASGAGSYVRHSNDDVKSGSQAIRLHTEDVLDAFAQLISGTVPSASKRLGIEVSFRFVAHAGYFRIGLYYYTGSYLYSAMIKLDLQTCTLFCYDSTETWVEIADFVSLDITEFVYHTIKVVIDFGTLKYIRLLFDNQEYDLSDFDVYSTTDASSLVVSRDILFFADDGVGNDVYIDDFIFTQAEP